MLLFATYFVILINFSISFANDCDKNGILIYEDLGCTPEYSGENKCPTKFSCQGLNEDSGSKCFFRGKSYNDKEQIDNSLTKPSVHVDCFCEANNGSSKFTCGILDCPELFGGPAVELGCYRNYSLSSYCSVGQICPPFNEVKCTVKGQEYLEGQKFPPSNSCLECVCQKGFTGKNEASFCRRQQCGEQLGESASKIQKSCAPFYENTPENDIVCCPTTWVCPDLSEVILGNSTSEETCQFGKRSLKVGQYFEKRNYNNGRGFLFEEIQCKCVTPPLLKCHHN